MTRATLSSTNRTEIAKPAVRGEYLVSIVLPSVTLRGSTGDTDVVFGGNTYYGNAKFAGFSNLSEVPDLKARRVSISLAGLTSDLVNAAMTDKYHYAQINLYVAFFDENGALIADPHALGGTLYTSEMSITLGEREGAITLSAESLEIFNRRNSAVLATPQNQKRRYAGDTGMDRVRIIMEQEIMWGGAIGGGSAGGDRTFNDAREQQ